VAVIEDIDLKTPGFAAPPGVALMEDIDPDDAASSTTASSIQHDSHAAPTNPSSILLSRRPDGRQVVTCVATGQQRVLKRLSSGGSDSWTKFSVPGGFEVVGDPEVMKTLFVKEMFAAPDALPEEEASSQPIIDAVASGGTATPKASEEESSSKPIIDAVASGGTATPKASEEPQKSPVIVTDDPPAPPAQAPPAPSSQLSVTSRH
jgi:hypothetical protein